jgi:hypothetical protein
VLTKQVLARSGLGLFHGSSTSNLPTPAQFMQKDCGGGAGGRGCRWGLLVTLATGVFRQNDLTSPPRGPNRAFVRLYALKTRSLRREALAERSLEVRGEVTGSPKKLSLPQPFLCLPGP